MFDQLVPALDETASPAVLLDELRRLEELRSVVAARQAQVTAAFVAKRRCEQAAQGVPADRVGRGIAHEVALARRMSPHNATRYVNQVRVLVSDLPETFAALASGAIAEFRALLIAKETAWLHPVDRMAVDTRIAPRLGQHSTRRLIDTVKKAAYHLDPHTFMDRLAKADNDRHVSLRPAPDCMTTLTALLPLKQGVAVYAALKQAADHTVGVGDETRSRGQVMADTLAERVTGQQHATDVPVTVNLIMTDRTLLTADNQPARMIGGGVIPAELARRMITDPTGQTEVLLRRLYLDNGTGSLAAMETNARLFTENQRRFLILRDDTCRTPWCDAPIRHADHIIPHEHGGPTSITNAQGLCQACNHAKQAPGWRQQTAGDQIITTTPTGHRYAA